MTTGEPGIGIGEVAARSGVPASTIRYYEARGLLASPPRVSGRRRYDLSVFDRLTVIAAARRAGLTLREVGQLLEATTGDGTAAQAWQAVAARKVPELDAMIDQLRTTREVLRAVAACECSTLSECAVLLRERGVDRQPG